MGEEKKRLPVGLENFEQIINDNYYYVDKTLMIRDFLDKRPMVSLFTRPRRFGKTLNMDMLRDNGVNSIIRIGIAFRGKSAVVRRG